MHVLKGRAVGMSLAVCFYCCQTCCHVLESLKSGDFGCCDKTVQEYQMKCHSLFPCAAVFMNPSPKVVGDCAILTNGSVS